MQVQIDTDSNIEDNQAVAQQIESAIRDTLDRFSQHIIRMEVHLSDEKFSTHDKRCLIEAHFANHQLISVSDQAATLEQSISCAAEKMKHLLEDDLILIRPGEQVPIDDKLKE